MFQNVIDNNVSSSLTRYHEEKNCKMLKCFLWKKFKENRKQKPESQN